MNTCIIIYDTESMILQAINTHQYKQVFLYNSETFDVFFYTNIYIITHKHEIQYNI